VLADIQPVGIAASAGVDTSLPRADHVHPGFVLLAFETTDATAPADAAENTLFSVVIPANTLGTTRLVRVFFRCTIAGVANTKTLRFKLDATTYHTIVAAAGDQDPRWITWYLCPDDATNAQESFLSSDAALAPELRERATGAVDTTSDRTLAITAQKANAGDAVVGQVFIVEFIQ
jgi:hypothetical protein